MMPTDYQEEAGYDGRKAVSELYGAPVDAG